jgi:hypothetical protein
MYFPLLIISSLIIFVASEKTFLHFRYVLSKKVIYFGPEREIQPIHTSLFRNQPQPHCKESFLVYIELCSRPTARQMATNYRRAGHGVGLPLRSVGRFRR